MASGRLAGKIAIVTGTAGGIGKGIGVMFAREGARVYGCDVRVPEAQATLEQMHAEGLAFASLHPCDLPNPADVDRLVAACVDRFGGIDILVNAAAIAVFNFIEDMDYQTGWRKTLTGELDVVFLATKAAWPHMKARGAGSILNFASANAYHALPGSGALGHCAGKGGVLAMTRQLAMEGGPHNIRANTISPGMIVTDHTQTVLAKPGFTETVLAKTMIRRLGQPDDISYYATFLASDESSWVTASDFSIDGGATAW
jgi:NAD(P)-dependent dehydrogenase (short-subunit alcohol dehydrogenase family)